MPLPLFLCPQQCQVCGRLYGRRGGEDAHDDGARAALLRMGQVRPILSLFENLNIVHAIVVFEFLKI
jgi:hypothetical protein